MIVKLLSTAAITLLLASPAFACEMHQAHRATITTAAVAPVTEPAARLQPVVLPQSKATDAAAMTVAPEEVKSPMAYGGCHNRRQTTVLLTN